MSGCLPNASWVAWGLWGHLVFEGISKGYKKGTLMESAVMGVFLPGLSPPLSVLGSGPAESWAARKGGGEDFPGLEVARQ